VHTVVLQRRVNAGEANDADQRAVNGLALRLQATS
jgi:hypothetical protein